MTSAVYINLVISACINDISFPITTVLNGQPNFNLELTRIPVKMFKKDTNSEGDYEPNERSSERNESEKEQKKITVVAIVHCNPVTNNEISESIIEDGDTLPERIAHQNLTSEVAEKESHFACSLKSE